MKRQASLGILFLVVFVDLLGFGMVIPVMPIYAEHLGASEAATGWLSTGYSLMQFVFAPIWGRLSDRVGRRPVLLLSIAMTALAFLLYGVAATFVVLLVSRLFAGAATANIAIAQAYVADVTTPEGRAKGMGMIGAAFGLGFVFGPAVGGLLAGYSLSAPGLAAAALSLLNLVGAYFLLPEPAQHVIAARSRGRFEALREEFRKPGIRRILFIYLVVTLAFSAMEATYAFLAHRHFGLTDRHVSWLFTYIGVIVVLVQGGLIGPLTRRFGEKRLLVAGTILQGVALAALPFASGVTGPPAGHRSAGLRVGALEPQHHVAAVPVQPGRGPGRHAGHRPVGVGAGPDRRPAGRNDLLRGLAGRPLPGRRGAHGRGRRRGRHRLRPGQRGRARPGRGDDRVMR